MTRIGTIDQILLLLREQLQRAGEGRTQLNPSSAGTAGRPEPRPLDRARTLASLDAIDPDERRRLVIRTLLLEELGDKVGNDPAFASLVERVLTTMQDVPGASELIDRAIGQLRESG